MIKNLVLRASAFILVVFVGGCKVEQPKNRVTVDLNDRKQIIRNFGASDAWSCQFVGQWPDEKKNAVADWLFSKELDADGQPKGIGLSLWRFNIGAGSADQGNIHDEWRSTESFLKKDGTYDWTKQAGQRWFLDAARERGVEKYLAFTNSPPVNYTKNGNAFSGNGEEANLPVKNYLPFAQFLTSVLKEFKDQGKPFDYVSPFNEPQWDWTKPSQEGTPFKNSEIFSVTTILDSLLIQSNLATKIQVAEAGKLTYLYSKSDKPTRGDQISSFFNTASPHYLGDHKTVDKVISGHSYFTSAPADTLRSVRENVFNKLQSSSVPLEFWQSEYCLLGDHEEVKANGKGTGIDPALYVSRIIHHDLTVGNASAWHWWLAITPYDYKDGLIYVDKSKTDGAIEDTKLLWALGNFSRFIRPGSVRVGIASTEINIDNPVGLMLSSYLNAETGELTVVAINYGESDESIALDIHNGTTSDTKAFITGPGADEKLKPYSTPAKNGEIIIPKRSIVSVVSSVKETMAYHQKK